MGMTNEQISATVHTLFRLSPEELEYETDEMAREAAPRRFAVCVLNYGESDAVVLAWGLQFSDGGVSLIPQEMRLRGSFRSLSQVMSICERRTHYPCRVVWVDEAYPPLVCTEDDPEDGEPDDERATA